MFVQFNAESQILLEQLFIYALRKHLPFEKDPNWREACHKLLFEEFHHARAYRKFLRSEDEILWPKWSMTLRGHRWTKRYLCFLLRRDPVCMIPSAAKFETYSLAYSAHLTAKYDLPNRWTELNRMHRQDEVHHVSFDYHWYEEMVRARSPMDKFFTVLRVISFFVGIQVLLVDSCFKIITKVYPEASLTKRVALGLRFAYWGVRCFQPYVVTRKKLREAFQKHKFIHHRILSFMYW